MAHHSCRISSATALQCSRWSIHNRRFLSSFCSCTLYTEHVPAIPVECGHLVCGQSHDARHSICVRTLHSYAFPMTIKRRGVIRKWSTLSYLLLPNSKPVLQVGGVEHCGTTSGSYCKMRDCKTRHLLLGWCAMVMKPTNTYKRLRLSYIIYIVCLLHVL